jgi:hypothetical protein
MPTVRVRYTATDEAFSAMLHAFESIPGIEHIEEVADLVPHMDDEDSSSAGLHDVAGADVHEVEIIAPNEESVRRVHDVAELVARDYDGIVEFPENV